MTVCVALASGTKSPPGADHCSVSNMANVQVASPGSAGAPWPPLIFTVEPSDAPSPQSRVTRCNVTPVGPASALETKRVKDTLLIVAPAGTVPAMSKASRQRRLLGPAELTVLVRPDEQILSLPVAQLPLLEHRVVLRRLYRHALRRGAARHQDRAERRAPGEAASPDARLFAAFQPLPAFGRRFFRPSNRQHVSSRSFLIVDSRFAQGRATGAGQLQ